LSIEREKANFSPNNTSAQADIFWAFDFGFPLSRAEHRRCGREKARGLSESAVAQAKAGEFPRAPAAPTTRRVKRGTGAFFWLLFLRG